MKCVGNHFVLESCRRVRLPVRHIHISCAEEIGQDVGMKIFSLILIFLFHVASFYFFFCYFLHIRFQYR